MDRYIHRRSRIFHVHTDASSPVLVREFPGNKPIFHTSVTVPGPRTGMILQGYLRGMWSVVKYFVYVRTLRRMFPPKSAPVFNTPPRHMRGVIIAIFYRVDETFYIEHKTSTPNVKWFCGDFSQLVSYAAGSKVSCLAACFV
jgi:hypothetical protein